MTDLLPSIYLCNKKEKHSPRTTTHSHTTTLLIMCRCRTPKQCFSPTDRYVLPFLSPSVLPVLVFSPEIANPALVYKVILVGILTGTAQQQSACLPAPSPPPSSSGSLRWAFPLAQEGQCLPSGRTWQRQLISVLRSLPIDPCALSWSQEAFVCMPVHAKPTISSLSSVEEGTWSGGWED